MNSFEVTPLDVSEKMYLRVHLASGEYEGKKFSISHGMNACTIIEMEGKYAMIDIQEILSGVLPQLDAMMKHTPQPTAAVQAEGKSE